MVTDKAQQNRKVTRIVAIVAESFLVFDMASGMAKHGLSKPVIYWIAAVIEVGLAYLTYKLQNRSRLASGLIALFAFAAPLALFYSNVPSLKPAGSAMWVYVMAGLAFTIYDPWVIKSPDSVITNRMLLVLQIPSGLFLATIPAAFIGLAVILSRSDFTSAFKASDPTLSIVQITFGILSAIVLVIGLFLPNLFRWRKSGERTFFEIRTIHTIRIGLLESIAIYGFIVGWLGGTWLVWVPMLIVSGLGQAAVFPTRKRVVLWLGSENSAP